jgi:hypothetical protein
MKRPNHPAKSVQRASTMTIQALSLKARPSVRQRARIAMLECTKTARANRRAKIALQLRFRMQQAAKRATNVTFVVPASTGTTAQDRAQARVMIAPIVAPALGLHISKGAVLDRQDFAQRANLARRRLSS